MGARFVRETAYVGYVDVDPAAMARSVAWLLDQPTGTVLVLAPSGDLVGMIGMLAMPHFVSGQMVASELFWWVEPESRGHGVRLLRAAERWAASVGATHIHMIAPGVDVARLYERLGYTQIERVYQRRVA